MGTSCYIALELVRNKQRLAAFPFDWILSFDHEKFVDLLTQKCADFTNPIYLKRSPSGTVVHTKWMLDFRHDWKVSSENEWNNEETTQILAKYNRRIQRFFTVLQDFKGTVHFYRTSFPKDYDPTGLSTYTRQACEPMPLELQIKLFNTLQTLFPNLLQIELHCA